MAQKARGSLIIVFLGEKVYVRQGISDGAFYSAVFGLNFGSNKCFG
ncbi:MAG: hypothetical protein KAR05_10970 [Candidatus Omnitrophica bacterium]|nr:hypothetical protein [Candidatus Omnitrophota bacterium]